MRKAKGTHSAKNKSKVGFIVAGAICAVLVVVLGAWWVIAHRCPGSKPKRENDEEEAHAGRRRGSGRTQSLQSRNTHEDTDTQKDFYENKNDHQEKGNEKTVVPGSETEDERQQQQVEQAVVMREASLDRGSGRTQSL